MGSQRGRRKSGTVDSSAGDAAVQRLKKPGQRFYTSAFTPEEWAEIKEQLATPELSLEMEVAVMRVLIRRVMERIGEDDPVKALPLVRQGVDAICRALRSQRVLTGEAADSLSEAFAVALREIGE
ncbi:MAG: hypothetical protein H5T63_00740, partial [Chloroflexi bacterium]|nr:hypothetical protein [Chloroflexota bacterium]